MLRPGRRGGEGFGSETAESTNLILHSHIHILMHIVPFIAGEQNQTFHQKSSAEIPAVYYPGRPQGTKIQIVLGKKHFPARIPELLPTLADCSGREIIIHRNSTVSHNNSTVPLSMNSSGLINKNKSVKRKKYLLVMRLYQTEKDERK